MDSMNISFDENNVVLSFNEKNNKVPQNYGGSQTNKGLEISEVSQNNDVHQQNIVVDLSGYREYLAGILTKTNFKGDPVESYFAYLINFIVANNLASLIFDLAHQLNYPHIVVEGPVLEAMAKSLQLDGFLMVGEHLGNACRLLLDSDEYRAGEFSVEFMEAANSGIAPVGEVEILTMAALLNFQPQAVKNRKEQLRDDLIAFQFVKKTNTNEKGRFTLPIYVEDGLGFDTQQNIQGWASMHYLEMLSKIHGFFIQRYGMDKSMGSHNDDLMVALIDLLDFKLSPYPTGLQKSLEVGRSTAGKCAFIAQAPPVIAIPEEIRITLQAKDALGIVPRIQKLPLKGV